MRGNLRPRVAIGLPGSGCGVSRTAPPELRQLFVGLHPASGRVGRRLEAGMRSLVDKRMAYGARRLPVTPGCRPGWCLVISLTC